MSLILIKLENVHFANALDILDLSYIITEICLLALHIWSFLFVPAISLIAGNKFMSFHFLFVAYASMRKKIQTQKLSSITICSLIGNVVTLLEVLI